MIFNNDDLQFMRETLTKELRIIKSYQLADNVELLKDDEVKDILLKVFLENYKKGV